MRSCLSRYVRPRRLASGVDLAGDKLVLRDAAAVDGLTAGVYLAYAPWRPPVELPVSADGTAALPPELRDAGPLRVLLRIDDPWTVSELAGVAWVRRIRCRGTGRAGIGGPGGREPLPLRRRRGRAARADALISAGYGGW